MYLSLDHSKTLGSEGSHCVSNIYSRHITSKYCLNCVVNGAVCSSSTNTSTQPSLPQKNIKYACDLLIVSIAMHEANKQSMKEMNLQCTTMGPRFGSK